MCDELSTKEAEAYFLQNGHGKGLSRRSFGRIGVAAGIGAALAARCPGPLRRIAH